MITSTLIHELRKKYHNSVSLISGRRTFGHKTNVDGIVMHSAYTFSNNVCLLDACKCIGDSDIIYICGLRQILFYYKCKITKEDVESIFNAGKVKVDIQFDYALIER